MADRDNALTSYKDTGGIKRPMIGTRIFNAAGDAPDLSVEATQVALLASQGDAAAAVAGTSGASTTNGYLRFLRDKLQAGLTLAAGSAVIGSVIRSITATSLSDLGFFALNAANDTGVLVGSAGAKRLLGGSLCNNSAMAVWYKFYDKASAAVAADTPVLTVMVPPASTIPLGAVVGDAGKRFTLGMSYRIVGGITNSDATFPAVGVASISLTYI